MSIFVYYTEYGKTFARYLTNAGRYPLLQQKLIQSFGMAILGCEAFVPFSFSAGAILLPSSSSSTLIFSLLLVLNIMLVTAEIQTGPYACFFAG